MIPTYDSILKEILQVVPDGNMALKVMDVLKRQELLKGTLTEPIEWIFNFKDGGWNTVYALTLKEAKEKVTEKYSTLSPLLHSVRPSARLDYESNMRNFD